MVMLNNIISSIFKQNLQIDLNNYKEKLSELLKLLTNTNTNPNPKPIPPFLV
jgi:hypothetical protein